MINEKEYLNQLENWKYMIRKQAHRLSLINHLNYPQQQDLIQVGKIAVWEALVSSETNGKTGNDANGLIRTYITGKMQTYITSQLQVVRVSNNYYYSEDHRERNGKIPSYSPSHLLEDTLPNQDEDNDMDDMDWIDKQAIDYALSQITPLQYSIVELKFGLNGKEPMQEKDIAKKLNIRKTYINSFIHKVLPALAKDRQIRLQVNKKKKYGSTIKTIN